MLNFCDFYFMERIYSSRISLLQIITLFFSSYVKDEFQRHKTANEAHTYYFMQEWTKYYVTLSNQIGRDGKKRPLGQKMNDTELEKFTDDQLRQLHDLYVELKSPADDGSTNASKT